MLLSESSWAQRNHTVPQDKHPVSAWSRCCKRDDSCAWAPDRSKFAGENEAWKDSERNESLHNVIWSRCTKTIFVGKDNFCGQTQNSWISCVRFQWGECTRITGPKEEGNWSWIWTSWDIKCSVPMWTSEYNEGG